MKNLFRIQLVLLFLLLLSGCAQVPSSRIRFGGASAYLPKDLTADSIEVILRNGTNTMTFKAVKLSTRNNPEVIVASGHATADEIAAIGKVATDAVAAGAKGATKAVVP